MTRINLSISFRALTKSSSPCKGCASGCGGWLSRMACRRPATPENRSSRRASQEGRRRPESPPGRLPKSKHSRLRQQMPLCLWSFPPDTHATYGSIPEVSGGTSVGGNTLETGLFIRPANMSCNVASHLVLEPWLWIDFFTSRVIFIHSRPPLTSAQISPLRGTSSTLFHRQESKPEVCLRPKQRYVIVWNVFTALEIVGLRAEQ